MLSNETLIGEGKNTFQGKSIVGTESALKILECSSSQLDKLCHNRLIKFSKPKTINLKGETVDGRMRYFEVSDLYEFMMSNPTEKL